MLKNYILPFNSGNACECNSTSSTTTQGSMTSSPALNQQCNCNKDDSTKSPPSGSPTTTILSSQAKFQAISALAVSQDGVVHVADQGKQKIDPHLLYFYSSSLW